MRLDPSFTLEQGNADPLACMLLLDVFQDELIFQPLSVIFRSHYVQTVADLPSLVTVSLTPAELLLLPPPGHQAVPYGAFPEHLAPLSSPEHWPSTLLTVHSLGLVSYRFFLSL